MNCYYSDYQNKTTKSHDTIKETLLIMTLWSTCRTVYCDHVVINTHQQLFCSRKEESLRVSKTLFLVATTSIVVQAERKNTVDSFSLSHENIIRRGSSQIDQNDQNIQSHWRTSTYSCCYGNVRNWFILNLWKFLQPWIKNKSSIILLGYFRTCCAVWQCACASHHEQQR